MLDENRKHYALKPQDLIYTIAFDPPGVGYHRFMAKLLVSSIYCTGFSGDLIVFKNCIENIFAQSQRHVTEVRINTDAYGDDFAYRCQTFKYMAREFVQATSYDNVIFIDADCLCLDNPSELASQEVELGYAVQPLGRLVDQGCNAYLTSEELQMFERTRECEINSGTFFVKGALFDMLLEEWRRVDLRKPLREKHSDQPAWVRVVLDSKLKRRPFQSGLVVRYPLWEQCAADNFHKAIVLHFCGLTPKQKLAHMVGHYCAHFDTDLLERSLSLLEGDGKVL